MSNKRLPSDIGFLKSKVFTKPTLLVIRLLSAITRVISKVRASALFPEAKSLACHWSVEIKYPENIELGDGVVLGKGVTLGGYGGVILGDNVKASKGVVIESAGLDFRGEPPYQHISKPITIGDNVWLGTNAIVLAGVTIGDNAIIGANSVVTKDIEKNAIYVGSKGRIVGENHKNA